MKLAKGAALSEYAIIIALISLAMVPIFFMLGSNLVNVFLSYLNMFTSNNTQIVSNAKLQNPSNSGENTILSNGKKGKGGLETQAA